ncbi:hypothetical protein [Gracilimonas sp.]|uniref:hypothetical protein n=1 Tax=Gracilimonas sp. TaxID=1974203 RepID=UPI0032EE831B
MRYFFLLILFVTGAGHIFAQPLFEQGHYYDLGQNKTEGLISIYSVIDENPYFLFKKKHRGKQDTVFFRDVSEINVSDFKFIRKDTKVLTVEEAANDSAFTEESLLLRVEVEGEATLYSVKSGDDYTFYFSMPGQMPEQLIYAQYFRSDGRLARDNAFREQLASSLQCGSYDFSFLRYNKEQLITAFSDYNNCVQEKFKRYTGIPSLSAKYLNVGISYGRSKYFVESTNVILDTENARFTGTTPYIEADVEYLIPSLKNRIGFFFTGGYVKFSDSDERILLGTQQVIDLEYQVIQSTIGVRGYWPVNNALKLYGELGLGKDFESGKGISINYEVDGRGYQDFDNTRLTGHLTGGIGIAFFNRYIIQAKFKHLDTQVSGRSSDQRVKQALFMVGFKYLLKSYYK